jgi:hypothetical protein
MSNKPICIRVCLNFSTDPSSKLETKIFRYDDQNDTVEITPHELRQLLLSNGKNVNVETSFGDGHETRQAVGLLDVLGEARTTVYARNEPSNDDEVTGKQDVIIYEDQEATKPIARFPWHYSESKPRHGDSIITLNCSKKYLIWLTDLVEAEV